MAPLRRYFEAVEKSALPCFADEAATLATFFGSPEKAVQACLAKIAGYEAGKPPDRSLLTNTENYVTCLYAAGLQIHSISYVWNFLRRSLPPDVCDAFKGMQLVADSDELLQSHPAIVYFLTMLVGAGGNAGNQSAVRVIRGLALGTVNDDTRAAFVVRELKMAVGIALVMLVFGSLRLAASNVAPEDAFAIALALTIIVFLSVVAGAVLPLVKILRVGTSEAKLHASLALARLAARCIRLWNHPARVLRLCARSSNADFFVVAKRPIPPRRSRATGRSLRAGRRRSLRAPHAHARDLPAAMMPCSCRVLGAL